MSESIEAARMPVSVRIVKYWLPVAAMLALMYYFSTDVFSAENTRSVIDKIFLWFLPHATRHNLTMLNYFVRKSARNRGVRLDIVDIRPIAAKAPPDKAF